MVTISSPPTHLSHSCIHMHQRLHKKSITTYSARAVDVAIDVTYSKAISDVSIQERVLNAHLAILVGRK